MEGPEWNIRGAVAAQARARRGCSLQRLRRRFAPGGMLHFGQGKWYPGEPLPRWALGVLLAQRTARRSGATARLTRRRAARRPVDARRRTRASPRRSRGAWASPASTSIPAYEDVSLVAMQEQQLPVNVDPLASALDDPDERRRLARLLGRPTRQARRIRPAADGLVRRGCAPSRGGIGAGGRAPWPLRRGRLFLTPATRRWVAACRSPRCPGVLPEDDEPDIPPDPVRRARDALGERSPR